MKRVSRTELGQAVDWLVVLRPDGVVDLVEGAPAVWVGHTLDSAPDAPPAVREAASELLSGYSTAYVNRRIVRLPGAELVGGRALQIELLLVDALPLRRAHTRIAELVVRTMAVFAAQAGNSDVDLTVAQSPTVPPVFVLDGEKIAWALATLVGNALRFSRERDKKRGAAHVSVRVDWDEANQTLVISVADNGHGMTEPQRRWLFERDPASGKAAGLAVLMVRDVVLAHRGSVGVESQLGKGTTFTMRIPRSSAG